MYKRAISPGESGTADRSAQGASSVEERLGSVLRKGVWLVESMCVAGALSGKAQVAATVVCLKVRSAFFPVIWFQEGIVPVVCSNFRGFCVGACVPDAGGG